MNRLTYTFRYWFGSKDFWKVLILLALLIRVVTILVLGDEPLVGDSLYYYLEAQEFLHGEALPTYWPPGLELYEAGWMSVFGDDMSVLRWSMLPWFLLLAYMLYSLVSHLHSQEAGNIALFFLAVYPAFIHHSVEPLTQLPTAALLFALFNWTRRFLERKRSADPWRIGIALGLLVLFRPSSLLIMVFVPFITFVRRRKLVPSLTMILIPLVMVGTWLRYAERQTGYFVPINQANSRNFYLGNNAWTHWYKTWYFGSHWSGDPTNPEAFREELAELDALPAEGRGKAFMMKSLDHIGSRPDLFAVRTLSRVRTFLAFDTFTGSRLRKPPNPWPLLAYPVILLDAICFVSVVCLALIFFAGGGKKEVEGKWTGLGISLGLLYALPYFISFSHPTYHLPVLPLLLIPASIMATRLMGSGLKNQVWTKLSAPKLIVFLLIFFLIQIEWILQMTLG